MLGQRTQGPNHDAFLSCHQPIQAGHRWLQQASSLPIVQGDIHQIIPQHGLQVQLLKQFRHGHLMVRSNASQNASQCADLEGTVVRDHLVVFSALLCRYSEVRPGLTGNYIPQSS